jgi:hypothetical protein
MARFEDRSPSGKSLNWPGTVTTDDDDDDDGGGEKAEADEDEEGAVEAEEEEDGMAPERGHAMRCDDGGQVSEDQATQTHNERAREQVSE